MTTVAAGRILTGVVSALLLVDAYGKLAELEPVIQSAAGLGYPIEFVFLIGAIELLCVIAYLVPASAVLGAILLTGYLGGAVATHLRLDNPLWTHVLSGVYIGVLVWAGLAMRQGRVRELLAATLSRPAS